MSLIQFPCDFCSGCSCDTNHSTTHEEEIFIHFYSHQNFVVETGSTYFFSQNSLNNNVGIKLSTRHIYFIKFSLFLKSNIPNGYDKVLFLNSKRKINL